MRPARQSVCCSWPSSSLSVCPPVCCCPALREIPWFGLCARWRSCRCWLAADAQVRRQGRPNRQEIIHSHSLPLPSPTSILHHSTTSPLHVTHIHRSALQRTTARLPQSMLHLVSFPWIVTFLLHIRPTCAHTSLPHQHTERTSRISVHSPHHCPPVAATPISISVALVPFLLADGSLDLKHSLSIRQHNTSTHVSDLVPPLSFVTILLHPHIQPRTQCADCAPVQSRLMLVLLPLTSTHGIIPTQAHHCHAASPTIIAFVATTQQHCRAQSPCRPPT